MQKVADVDCSSIETHLIISETSSQISTQNIWQNKEQKTMTIIIKKLFITQQIPLFTGNQQLLRITFLFNFLIGILQISVGVGFLLKCRNALQPIPCVFVLKAQPCNGLEAPGYGGILNIAISSFGLSCLEQKHSAILLLMVSFAEFLVGLHFLHAQPIFFKDYFKIPTVDDICKNHKLEPGKLSLCWRNLQLMYPSCGNQTNKMQIVCHGLHMDYIRSPSDRLDFTNSKDSCAYLINKQVSLIYTSTRHLSGITVLLLDVFCILLAFLLVYFHQKHKGIKVRKKLLEQIGVLANNTDRNTIKQTEDFL